MKKIPIIDIKVQDWTKPLLLPMGWYKSHETIHTIKWQNDQMEKFVQISDLYKDIPWAVVFGFLDNDGEWKYYIKYEFNTKQEAIDKSLAFMKKMSESWY